MKAQTYDGWRLLGYQVREGEEATGRNTRGEATFTRDQVDDGPVRSGSSEDPLGEDWD